MRTVDCPVGIRFPLWTAVLLHSFSWCVFAQEQQSPETEPASLITVREIEASIQSVQSTTTLDENIKNQAIALYNEAITHVRARDDWAARKAEFQQTRDNAPGLLQDIQEQLLERLEDPNPAAEFTPNATETEAEQALDEATTADLELFLAEADRRLTQLRTEFGELEKEPGRRIERRKLIPESQKAARQRLTEAVTQLNTLASSTEPAELVEAKRTVQRARIQSIEQELQSYVDELQSYDARGRLLTARLDLLTRQKRTAEGVADAWRLLVSERRKEEAKRAEAESREALLQAVRAPQQIRDEVKRVAQENVDIASALTGSDGILRRFERAQQELEQTESRLSTLESDFTSVQVRVKAAGNSEAIAVLLRTKRASLPKIADLRRNIRLRSQTISKVQFDRLEYDDKRRAVGDVEAVVANQLEELTPDVAGNQRERLAGLLRDTYNTRRGGLTALLIEIDNYELKLFELDAKEKDLIEAARKFENYIDEHILWIQSGSVFDVGDARNAVSALLWLGLPDNLVQIPKAFYQDYLNNPVPLTVIYALPIVLVFAGRMIRKRVYDLGDQAAKRRCTKMTPTLMATLFVLVWSAGLPLLLGVIGWRLSTSLYSGGFARAAGAGLMTAAMALWTLYLPRLVLRTGSLGDKHFAWPKEPLRKMSKYLAWFIPIAVTIVFVITLFEADGELDRQESAGRFLFVLLLLLVARMSYLLARPRGGALLDAFDIWRGRGRLGARRFWFLLSVAVPTMLIIAAGAGYYYSALRLASRLYLTTFVAFGLLLAAAVVLRWSLVARRRIAIEQAKRRLEALKAEAAEGEKPPEEPELDLAKVDSQTGRLVRSTFLLGLLIAMWFIWAEFLPALSVLNEAEVWTTTVETTTQEQSPNGEVETRVVPLEVPITWRDVVVALLIGIATFIAVQNVPGLLEFAVLQRLPLVAGERYAVKTIFGYGLVLVGFLWAVSTIGLGWSQVQWLVAAVGLGLGFGMQEIFANFIAGLIILFEQPIRVGDTVTVGDTSGRVSKIRIRATWITAFNRQELIVPNKEFVTGRLINWTLSDQVLRIEVPVGIAYGSDTKKARQLLYEVAEKNELVMKDPAPEVYFHGFGDNSLSFELRVYSPDIDSFLRIKDQMHEAVDAAFRKAKIEIAFPQRDVHIRHIKDVLPIVQREEEPKSKS